MRKLKGNQGKRKDQEMKNYKGKKEGYIADVEGYNGHQVLNAQLKS